MRALEDDGGLSTLLRPRSVAVLGASDDPKRIGGRPVAYLLQAGFAGAIVPVNPNRAVVQGLPAVPDIGSAGVPVDLAIVSLPAELVVDAVRDCARAGVGSAIVFSAGFAEVGAEGAARQAELTAVARTAGIRVLGPNCLGVMNPAIGLSATFTASIDAGAPYAGSIGFVSQSGAFGSHCFAAVRRRGLGFSAWVTTGNEADVEFSDCLAYLATDPATKVIAAYIEGCRDGERLHRALALARECGKPVVALKVGRSEAGARAAASHTASLVGSDDAYNALFRRYGVHRAESIEELLDVTEAVARGGLPANRRTGLITVSGGVGILMADAAADVGLLVAPLPEAAQKELLEAWPYAAVANPVDTTAQTINDPTLFSRFFETMLRDGDYGSVIAFLTHVGLSATGMERIRGPLAEVRGRYPDRVVILSVLTTPEVRSRLVDDGFLVVEDPSAAVRVAAALAGLGEAPPAAPETAPGTPAANSGPRLAPGVVTEVEARRLVRAAGVPVCPERLVTTADDAVQAAQEFGGAVALKVVAPGLEHKSEIGGVLLDVEREQAVRTGFARLAAMLPDSTDPRSGVLVSPMAGAGLETIVGVRVDPVLGPVVVLGMGGVLVEALGDVVVAPAPCSLPEAQDMVRRMRAGRLFGAFRGRPPRDVQALAEAVVALSRLGAELAEEIDSLEVNPLLVLEEGQGVQVLDALVVR